MGCWDATCLVSNLAIRAGDKVRLLLLERQTGDDFWYTYPNSAWQVVGLPVKGEYNDYGGIAEVDAASPEARLLVAIAKRLFGQKPEFASVEAVADYLWQHSRWIYQKNERGVTVAGWAEVHHFDYDAQGKYGRLQDKGRDERGDLLPNHYMREFGYTLVLEEFYEVMIKAACASAMMDLAYLHQNITKAVADEKAGRVLYEQWTASGSKLPLSPARQVKLDKLRHAYSEWRRKFIPLRYEGLAELEDLLLAEVETGAVETKPGDVPTRQARLSYALAEFHIFDEAMALGRRHYTPQSTGVQHDGVNEYEFHQTLARTIITQLDKRIAEINAQPDGWEDDVDGWDEGDGWGDDEDEEDEDE